MNFEKPTQVAFYDPTEECYMGGLAWNGNIICMCCGGVIEIEEYLDDLNENFPEVAKPIIPLEWCNFNEEFLGDLVFNISTGEVTI